MIMMMTIIAIMIFNLAKWDTILLLLLFFLFTDFQCSYVDKGNIFCRANFYFNFITFMIFSLFFLFVFFPGKNGQIGTSTTRPLQDSTSNLKQNISKTCIKEKKKYFAVVPQNMQNSNNALHPIRIQVENIATFVFFGILCGWIKFSKDTKHNL